MTTKEPQPDAKDAKFKSPYCDNCNNLVHDSEKDALCLVCSRQREPEAAKERFTNKNIAIEISVFESFLPEIRLGQPNWKILLDIVKQLQSDLASQIQLTADWKKFFKDMRRQRDEIKTECLPWLECLVDFEAHNFVTIEEDDLDPKAGLIGLKSLIKKLGPV